MVPATRFPPQVDAGAASGRSTQGWLAGGIAELKLSASGFVAAASKPDAARAPRLIPLPLNFDRSVRQLLQPRVAAQRGDAAGFGGELVPGQAGRIDDRLVVIEQAVREVALL